MSGSRCPLCKMLNIISELKKHPNESGFFHLSTKADRLMVKRQGLEDICGVHRLPINFTADITSVADYINEVRHRAMGLVAGTVRVKSHDEAKRRLMQ